MGMGGGWGGGVGAVFAAGRGTQPGLPFGGIPEEMQEGVDRLLADEPEHGEPDVAFSHRAPATDRQRLSLGGLLAAHRRLAVAALAGIVVLVAANQAGPLLISTGIDAGMLGRDVGVLVAVVVGYAGSIALTAVAQRYLVMAEGRIAAGIQYALRLRIFTHLQRLGLDFYTDEKAGVVMTRMTSDIENLNQLLGDGLGQLVIQGLTMVVIAVVLFVLDVRLALVTIVLVVPALTVLSLWFRSASATGYLRVRDGIADVLADLSESLHGVRVVVSHNRQARNVVHHRNVLGDYREAYVYTAKVAAVYGPGSQLLGYLGQAVLLAIGGAMVVHHELSLGVLVAYFLYLGRFFQPIQLLVQTYNTYQQGMSSLVKLNGLLATDPGVAEAADAEPLPTVVGAVRFDHVSFGYDPAHPVLHDVDLDLRPGETVAFVGRTGAGKSTIAKLVARFYDPTEGRVLVDGHDISKVQLSSLRRQLGVVPQEPFLFVGTLRDNIAFADPDASDADVLAAVEAVGLGDLVERLPDGLAAAVHERGQSLSSGERQLIALARAFLARPRVLVLDEATSNLDLASEAKVEAALDRLLEGRTAILVAHRLTTAMKADRIAVVDAGRVVEWGPHERLVEAGGTYAAMYATWLRQGAGEEVA
ncbi:MAG: ABC transporter ATP-binding protein [Actinomycetota bacterium]|nr:ABC transporter ATP-binding protein [Actinomycetota bacterium]